MDALGDAYKESEVIQFFINYVENIVSTKLNAFMNAENKYFAFDKYNVPEHLQFENNI